MPQAATTVNNNVEELRRRLAERCESALRDCHDLGLTRTTLVTVVVRAPNNAAMVVMVTNDPDPRAAVEAAMAPSSEVIVPRVPR